MNAILLVSIFAYLFDLSCCNESYDYVSKECDNKLKGIETISKFKEFSSHYKILVKNYAKPKKDLLQTGDRLRHCYDIEEPIVELERIIDKRVDGVCKMDYINQLIQYHSKYLSKDDKDVKHLSNSTEGRKYMKRFFSYYAHQVAYYCKSRILDQLEKLQSRYDCSALLSRALPQASITEENSHNIKEDEIRNFLNSFSKIENFALNSIANKIKTPRGSYELIVPDEAIERVQSLKTQCLSRKPYYSALFSPVAVLAQLDYQVDQLSDIDREGLNSDRDKLLKCWLSTAQLCEGLLSTQFEIMDQELDKELESKLVTIRWGLNDLEQSIDLPDDELIDSSETFDEISPFIINLVKQKSSLKSKIKAKMATKLESFVQNHIRNSDAMLLAAEKSFIDALTDVDNGIDSKVGFAGKKYNDKKYRPTSVITDNADTIVMVQSSFLGKEVGMVMSCVVGVVLSAVFVWFSLYALASVVKQHFFLKKDDGNFKANYLELRKQHMDKLKNKKRGIFKFYKPT